jgi:hypothetical protein
MDTRWSVFSTGEEIHSAGSSPISVPISIPRIRQIGQSTTASGTMRVWDTQRGVVVIDIDIGEVAFSETQNAVTLVMGRGFRTCKGLTGAQLCEGELPSQYDHFFETFS